MKRLWFKRKLFGWGWYPSTWQGWLVTVVYMGIVLFFASTVDDESSTREVVFMFVFPFVLSTVTFIRIAYATGEHPKWSWGNKKRTQRKK